MSNRKLLLNHLLDIGGVATTNNLYSPEATTEKGAIVMVRNHVKDFVEKGFLLPLDNFISITNPANQIFYALTKEGAKFIEREDEYKGRFYKSPNPYMAFHESMKFDVCLAFLRLYPDYTFTFDYKETYGGIKPDATITMISKDGTKELVFLLEVERKKTIDRVYNDKIKNYEKLINDNHSDLKKLPKNFKILFVYSTLIYNAYLRPQGYTVNILEDVNAVRTMTESLATDSRYGGSLPDYRYRFLPFPDFYRLNQPVWHKPGGLKVSLL